MAKKIEVFTRQCYRSEGRMIDDSYQTFLSAVFGTHRHTGIAEHRMISVTFVTDRGVSHEGLRHRMAAPYEFSGEVHESGDDSYLQESTRYCDYAAEAKSPQGVTYVLPPWIDPSRREEFAQFIEELQEEDAKYAGWRELGWPPEQARYWLPQGVKTQYTMSANLGSWWNFCSKRTPVPAHPQMRQLAIPVARYLAQRLPQFFHQFLDCGLMVDNGNAMAPTGKFLHKGQIYDEAALIVRPFYEDIAFEEVPC